MSQKVDLNALLSDIDEFLDDEPAATLKPVHEEDDPYNVLDDYADDTPVEEQAAIPAQAVVPQIAIPRPLTSPAPLSPPVSIKNPPTQIRQLNEAHSYDQPIQRFPRKMSLTANPLYLRQNMPPPEYMIGNGGGGRSSEDHGYRASLDQLPLRSPSVMSSYSASTTPNQVSGSTGSVRSSRLYAAPVNAGGFGYGGAPISRSRSQYSDMHDSYKRGSMIPMSPMYEGASQFPSYQHFQYQQQQQQHVEQDPASSEVQALRMELERTKMELNDRHQMNQILLDEQRQKQEQNSLNEVRALREELERTKLELNAKSQRDSNKPSDTFSNRSRSSALNATSPGPPSSVTAPDSWDTMVAPHISGPVQISPAPKLAAASKDASDTSSTTSKASTTNTKKSWFSVRSKSVDSKKADSPKKKKDREMMSPIMFNPGMMNRF
ncbi:hypothetical protein BDR26DRAFT_1010114 [Obelidium mucronatum]|nr:hypothetical protein BDR26DRAFT_1010114 [Obelidium mucronatum]